MSFFFFYILWYFRWCYHDNNTSLMQLKSRNLSHKVTKKSVPGMKGLEEDNLNPHFVILLLNLTQHNNWSKPEVCWGIGNMFSTKRYVAKDSSLQDRSVWMSETNEYRAGTQLMWFSNADYPPPPPITPPHSLIKPQSYVPDKGPEGPHHRNMSLFDKWPHWSSCRQSANWHAWYKHTLLK